MLVKHHQETNLMRKKLIKECSFTYCFFHREILIQCQLNYTMFFAGTASTRVEEVRVDTEKTGASLKTRESPPSGLERY